VCAWKVNEAKALAGSVVSGCAPLRQVPRRIKMLAYNDSKKTHGFF
jgi:hypothetical protein